MDTAVWGPSTWDVCFDVAHICSASSSSSSSSATPTVASAGANAMLALQSLLPCKYCRQSYGAYLTRTQHAVAARGGDSASVVRTVRRRFHEDSVRWVYRLREFVNEKLGVPRAQRPSLATARARLRAWNGAASADSYWNMLFIIAVNYSPDMHPPAAVVVLVTSLARVLGASVRHRALCAALSRFVTTERPRDYTRSSRMLFNALHRHYAHWLRHRSPARTGTPRLSHVARATRLNSTALRQRYQRACADWRPPAPALQTRLITVSR